MLLEFVPVLLDLIKVIVLLVLHVLILTAYHVISPFVVDVFLDFMLQGMHALPVSTTVNNALMVLAARPVLFHTYTKATNVFLREMVQVVLLIQVEMFSHVNLDVKLANLVKIILLFARK